MGYKKRAVWKSFHRRTQRFALVLKHRRAGASLAAVGELIAHAKTTTRDNARYALVAPMAKQVKAMHWSYAKELARDDLSIRVLESNRQLEVTGKSGKVATISFYGADDPDSIRGGYLDGVILDEAADMKKEVWSDIIKPMLVDRKGWVAFLTTPRGADNWIKDIFDHAVANLDRWYIQRISASASKLFSAQDMAQAKVELSSKGYQEEMEAAFV